MLKGFSKKQESIHNMDDQEIALGGGNITEAARVGQTVRRTTGPWSSTVHALLRYLEQRHFAGAPRFLGIDAQGREILSFLEGEVGHYPLRAYMWSDENLSVVARLLRRYHDLIADFRAPAGGVWQFVYPDESQHEVICHNDVAPYNMIYQGGEPSALIDWDTAGPGPRIWDIAYALYRFIPLSYVQDIQGLGLAEPTNQARRLRLFYRAYGLETPYAETLNAVEHRLEALCTLLLERAHEPVYGRMIKEGHLDHYRREIATLREQRPALERLLNVERDD
jgi:hypothetical protein